MEEELKQAREEAKQYRKNISELLESAHAILKNQGLSLVGKKGFTPIGL